MKAPQNPTSSPFELTEGWQTKIANEARQTGFIGIEALAWLLAQDDRYSLTTIVEPWLRYECEVSLSQILQPPEGEPEHSEQSLILAKKTAWYLLLRKFCFGFCGGLQLPEDPERAKYTAYIPYLRLYQFNRVEGRYERYERSHPSGVPYIKLSDLENYLSSWLRIPLLRLLFPEFEEAHAAENGNSESSESRNSIFPCPPGTEWEDIKITLVTNETVRIKTPLGEKPFTFQQIRLAHKQNPERKTLLWTQLKILAQNQGIIEWKDYAAHKERAQTSDTMNRLDKHLQRLFGINNSIFKGSCKKLKRYDSKIFFSDQTIVVE